jgi:hypothetical protein
MHNLVAKMISNAYAVYNTGKIAHDIEGYTLIKHTPTILIYENKREKKIIYAIRGMKADNKTDISAVASILTSTLSSSTRYRIDKEIVKSCQTKGYTRIGAGHSLGGAIVDQLLADGLIDEGISFNPIFEITKIRNSGNTRIYKIRDPIYELIGKYASNVVVAPANFVDQIESEDIIFNLVRSYYAHKMEQFVDDDKPKGNSYIIQSVVLNKSKFPTLDKAISWAGLHNYKTTKYDETPNEWRFRQVEPSIFNTGIYKARSLKLEGVGFLVVAYKD